MKTTNILFYGLIAFVLYDLFTRSQGYISSKFSAIRTKIKFKLLTPEGVGAELTISLQNQTPVPVPVDDLFVQIYYRDQSIGAGKLAKPVRIAPNGITDIPLNIFIRFTGLSDSVISIIESGTLSDLIARGTVTSAGVSIPFEQTLSIV